MQKRNGARKFSGNFKLLPQMILTLVDTAGEILPFCLEIVTNCVSSGVVHGKGPSCSLAHSAIAKVDSLARNGV